MNKSALKHNVTETGSHFFERSSMKFFGDTMKNYYIPAGTVPVKTATGRTVECYELRRIRPVKHGLNAPAYFDTSTFERILSAKE